MRLKAVIDQLCAVAFWGLATGAPKAAQFWGLSFLWVIVTQENLTQILLPLHAVTRIWLLKLLWHADEQRTLLEDWNTHNALMWRRERGSSDPRASRASAQTGTFLKDSITQKGPYRLELFLIINTYSFSNVSLNTAGSSAILLASDIPEKLFTAWTVTVKQR